MALKFFRTACFGCMLSLFAQKPSPPAVEALLRTDSTLVLIPTHVTTAAGSSVTTLGRDNFRLMEDDVEQKIVHFSQDDAPVSIGILFDSSGSMRAKMHKASEAAAAFFKTSNAEDEFFLVEFNDRAKLVVPFTKDSDEIYQQIVRTKPFGRTSLLDAVHLALRQMKGAHNSRHAIVILSDGGDNWSRHSAREVRNALRESDVQVYAMGIFDPGAKNTEEEKNGPELLADLTEQSGGRNYRVDHLDDLPTISARISNDLRSEYLLGYYPKDPSRDGKFHKVAVRLALPGLVNQLRTYYRRGYYAPSE
jgi:Ca-activated chloride channel family protein